LDLYFVCVFCMCGGSQVLPWFLRELARPSVIRKKKERAQSTVGCHWLILCYFFWSTRSYRSSCTKYSSRRVNYSECVTERRMSFCPTICRFVFGLTSWTSQATTKHSKKNQKNLPPPFLLYNQHEINNTTYFIIIIIILLRVISK
jgi:hypothetical protein